MKRKPLAVLSSMLSLTVAHPVFGEATQPFRYEVPANIQDFADDTVKQQALNRLWNNNMNAFNLQAIKGNPWTNEQDSPRSNYLDPKQYGTQSDTGTLIHPITWTAFPNRVSWYFSTSQKNPYQVSTDLLYPLADDGRLNPDDPALIAWVSMDKSGTLKKELDQLLINYPAFNSDDTSNFAKLPVPSDICPTVNWQQPESQWKTGKSFNSFGPPGPRGWKDEYNEWVVTRNKEGKIIRVNFTAENPEYWFSLWHIDPGKVLQLYRQLVSENVRLEDLYLKDAQGNTVNDHRNKPYYNPLNKWNYGNRATPTSGGAAHLTSPPNTVGAEIFLGAAATIIRDLSPADYSPQENNCVSEYGSSFRNSDPNIGFQANQVVKNLKFPISLSNPIALYMQRPDFSNYKLPETETDPEARASDFFKILRGKSASETGRNYDQILHAVFEVPADRGYTVSDITINGKPIWWGSQIAETFNQALAATAYIKESLKDTHKHPGVGTPDKQQPWPQPLVKNSVLKTINNTPSISAATIPLLPPVVEAGSRLTDMALEALEGGNAPRIEFTNPDGTVASDIKLENLTSYTPGNNQVPGKHKLYSTIIYVFDIDIGENVAPGQYGIRVSNYPKTSPSPVPAALTVIAQQ